MDLSASGVLMPLGPGWSPILTDLHIGESQLLASRGRTTAVSESPSIPNTPPAIGEQFLVQSFFDVFFDLSVTDVDPAANFGFGGAIDGQTMSFPAVGPGRLDNFFVAFADPAAPNFGLFPPPESAPYIGFFDIEIPLGADLNGNGEDDKIKTTLAALSVGDENRTFITLPDGTVIDSFETAMDWSGAVVDESQDPPFGPVILVGPTTASSRLVPSGTVPETGPTLFWFAGVVAGLIGCHLRARVGIKRLTP
jgi:hypothetical protein